MIHVSTHAIHRFQERVAPVSVAEARASILSHQRALEAAADFGCEVVRCGGGERMILQGRTVVTVYPAHELPRQCRSGFSQGAGQ